MPTQISHVIFDLDGLLINSEHLYTQIMNNLCAKYGKEFTWDLKKAQMGRKPREAAKVLIDALQLPITVDEYRSFCEDEEQALFPTSELMPGAQRLIEYFKAMGVLMCLATGSDSVAMAQKTVRHKDFFSKHFTHVVTGGDDFEVKLGKPNPMIFEIALSRFPSNPLPKLDEVLVFEDAPNGVEAGLGARMHVVWVPDLRADRSQFQENPDITILDSLLDFNPEQFGLPPIPK